MLNVKNSKPPYKLIIPILASLLWLPYIFTSFNPIDIEAYFQEGGLFPWIIILFCLGWLIINRGRLVSTMSKYKSFLADSTHISAGTLLCLTSLLIVTFAKMNTATDKIFPAFLFIAGVFSMFGTYLPTILSFIYGVGIFLPVVFNSLVGIPYSANSTLIFTSILRTFGYPITAEGAIINITTASGGVISTYIDAICAGSSSLAVFICLFLLVTLDLNVKLSKKTAFFLFLGCIGTYIQAILRLITMSLVGFYYGEEAFWTAHTYAGYIIFSIYFSFFCYFYIQRTKTQTR